MSNIAKMCKIINIITVCYISSDVIKDFVFEDKTNAKDIKPEDEDEEKSSVFEDTSLHIDYYQ